MGSKPKLDGDAVPEVAKSFGNEVPPDEEIPF